MIESLHRCGRILGTAMRVKEYLLQDVILMMGKNKEAEAHDIPDQVCLAYGHAVFYGVQLLQGYGWKDVDSIYPMVSPGSSINPDVEAQAIRELLDKEINLRTCPGFHFLAKCLTCRWSQHFRQLNWGGNFATLYARMISQIAEYGPMTDREVDSSHGVSRTFHLCDPIGRFPILDSDVDLSNGQISSSAVKQIFPSQFDQMVAKNIHTFMQPDFNAEEALRYVKEFIQRGEAQSTVQDAIHWTKG